jgi:hypothetical protein
MESTQTTKDFSQTMTLRAVVTTLTRASQEGRRQREDEDEDDDDDDNDESKSERERERERGERETQSPRSVGVCFDLCFDCVGCLVERCLSVGHFVVSPTNDKEASFLAIIIIFISGLSLLWE